MPDKSINIEVYKNAIKCFYSDRLTGYAERNMYMISNPNDALNEIRKWKDENVQQFVLNGISFYVEDISGETWDFLRDRPYNKNKKNDNKIYPY